MHFQLRHSGNEQHPPNILSNGLETDTHFLAYPKPNCGATLQYVHLDE